MENLYNSRNPAVKRIFKEAQELAEHPDEDFHAGPLQDNLFEWHFTIRGPVETPFENGLYHGRIILPADYPMKPPNIIILTPNGRFETNTKICLSISGYHPETWQPSWSIRTALKALIGFLPTPGSGAIGALDLPDAQRKQFAQLSRTWTCSECKMANCDLLPSPAVAGDNSNAEAKTPTNITDDGRQAEPYQFPSVGMKETVTETPSSPANPESASGDNSDDTFNRPPPPRPRTSSLQSRPGRGSGKRAHFADDPVTPTDFPASPPSFTKPFLANPPTATNSLPSTPPIGPSAAFVPTHGPLQEVPRSENNLTEMRQRQSLILQQRQKLLRDRLATAERAPAPSPVMNAGAFGVTDPNRLESMIQGLRQIVLWITVCLMIIVLRRVMLVLEDEDYSEL